jgi:hypothetical protein
MLAAIHPGGATCVRLLLGAGADPWAADSRGGRTALFYAACADAADSAAALLDATQGAFAPCPSSPNGPATRYVDVRMRAGFTALHVAVDADARGALRELLRAAPALCVRTLVGSYGCIACTRGTCPMHLAARLGHTEAAKMLLLAHVSAGARQGVRGRAHVAAMHAARLVAGAGGACLFEGCLCRLSSYGMRRPSQRACTTYWLKSRFLPTFNQKSRVLADTRTPNTSALRSLLLHRSAPQPRPAPLTLAPSGTALGTCPATWRPSAHTTTSHTCCTRACRSRAHWAAPPACTQTEPRPSSCWPRQRCADGSERRSRLRRPRWALPAAVAATLPTAQRRQSRAARWEWARRRLAATACARHARSTWRRARQPHRTQAPVRHCSARTSALFWAPPRRAAALLRRRAAAGRRCWGRPNAKLPPQTGVAALTSATARTVAAASAWMRRLVSA